MITLFLFLAIGILFYSQKNRTYFYVFLIYSLFVFKSVITYLGIGAPPVVNYLLFLLLPYSCVPYIKKVSSFSVVYLVLFLLYFVFKSLWNGMPLISTMILYISPFVLYLGAIALRENVISGRVFIRPLVFHLYIVLALQVIFIIIQSVVPSVGNAMHIESYEWQGNTVMLVNELHRYEGFGSGLLITSVIAAMFLSITSTLLCLYESISKGGFSLKLLIIIIATIPAGVLTGIRAPLFIFLLLIVLIIYRYERKYLLPAVILMVSGVVVFYSLTPNDDISGIARTQEGLATLFGSGNEGLADSTLGLSFLLIPFFLKNPVLGISLGEYKTLGISIGGDGFSSTDAQLLYTLCEIGIVGLIIWAYPYFKFIKSLKVDKKQTGINMLLLSAILLSIVDMGIFMIDIAFVFVLGCVILSSLSFKSDSLKNKNNV